MRLLQFKFLVLYLTSAQQTLAAINVFDGSYSTQNDDISFTRDRRDFKLRRYYSSRNVNKSYFGLGWCSDLDQNLHIKNSDELEYFDCEKNKTYSFFKSTVASTSGIKFATSATNSPLTILWLTTEQSFRLVNIQTTKQIIFNKSGLPVKISSRNQLDVTIHYDAAKKIDYFIVGRARKFNVQLNWFEQIEKIHDEESNNHYAYQYNNVLLSLISSSPIKEKMNPIYQYTYDEYNNLTQIINVTAKSREKMRYDTAKDRILTVSSANGCLSTVNYNEIKKLRTYKTNLKRSCRGVVQQDLDYIFQFKQGQNASFMLDQVVVEDKSAKAQKFLNHLFKHRAFNKGGPYVIFRADTN